jgi:hypothetical protein
MLYFAASFHSAPAILDPIAMSAALSAMSPIMDGIACMSPVASRYAVMEDGSVSQRFFSLMVTA